MAIDIEKQGSAPTEPPSLVTGGAPEGAVTRPATMIGLPQDPPVLPKEMTMDEQLFHAVLHSPLGLIEWLTNEVSDIDVRDADGCTPLHRAVLANRPQAVEVLLENNADADVPLPDGTLLLHRALDSRNAQSVELLLDNGADVDQLDSEGRSPLIHAVLLQDAASVEVLINNSADIELTGPDGLTPLQHAVRLGDKPCLKLLLDDGADADITDANGVPLLHTAVRCNRFIRRIVEQTSDADVTDADGNSALHVAILTGLPLDGLAKLLEYVQQDVQNVRGETPLFLAVLHRADLAVVKALLDDDPDVNLADLSGLAPLHLAIAQGNEAVFLLLLENNADVDAPDGQGHTPLDLVLQRPLDGLRDRMEKALRDEGAGVVVEPTSSPVSVDRGDRAPEGSTAYGSSRPSMTGTGPAGRNTFERPPRRTFWQWVFNQPEGKR